MKPLSLPLDFENQVRFKAKQELRKSMNKMRVAYPDPARRRASQLILEHLSSLDVYLKARSMALFRSIERKGEINTQCIDADGRNRSMRIAYPTLMEVEENRADLQADHTPHLQPVMNHEPPQMAFRWVDVSSQEELACSFEERGHMFEEPLLSFPIASLAACDVVVVPGLAFDPFGYRVGYGAGFYDRALTEVPKEKRVGICFDFQMIVESARMPHDVPVGWIVTDKRVFQAEEINL